MRYSVIIVGAGATGLTLANMLGRRGIDCLVLERELAAAAESRAVGIMPPSLAILDRFGLADRLVDAGVRVRRAVVHGTRRLLGAVVMDGLRSRFPFVLTLPQNRTETILEQALGEITMVTLRRGWAFTGTRPAPDGVSVDAIDQATGARVTHEAAWLCACDGFHSDVRAQLRQPFPGGVYGQRFLMGDFIDRTGFGTEAHFFFTRFGLVESFPLPGEKRRWNIDRPAGTRGTIESEIERRTGIRLDPADRLYLSRYRVHHHHVRRWDAGPILFAGDAAHVMSPIGGQGMNTGIADAALAVEVIRRALRPSGNATVSPGRYSRWRGRAAAAAGRRAWLAMRTGTLRGRLVSALRNIILAAALCLFPKMVPRYFSMMTIPLRGIERGRAPR